MNEQTQLNPQSFQPASRFVHGKNEIDLPELFSFFWADKWFIVAVTALFAICSLIYALLLTDIYRAEAVLAPAESDQNRGGLAAQFGSAAALLGVNVGSSGGENISTAIATLRSRQFIGRFIEENDLLVPLFAGTWDKRSGGSAIDDEIYDVESGTWLLKDGEPTEQEAYRAFMEALSVIGPDGTMGIVTVGISWHNPIEAAEWVNKLVAAINRQIKEQDVNEANRAIAYLRRQLEQTQLVDMQRVFYQLIESQTRITMLADVRDEYMFRVIDPATMPDQRNSPRRSLMVIIGAFAGVFLALLLAYLRRTLGFAKFADERQ